jgi:hypothetical protein
MSQPTIPQLTARHATLSDLVDVLRGQHAAKLDVVTAARNLHAADGRLHVAGAAHELTLDGVTRTDARLLPTTAADNQIAKKLDIPPQYLRRVREHHLGLYDANVNGWLAHDPQRRFLVRGLAAGEGETGVMRLPRRLDRHAGSSPGRGRLKSAVVPRTGVPPARDAARPGPTEDLPQPVIRGAARS